MWWGGLLTGAILALSIWIFDIDDPNVAAPLALGVGVVVSIIGFLSVAFRPMRFPGLGAGERVRFQREADESEVTDIEQDVEEP
jgi:hypothetical protein